MEHPMAGLPTRWSIQKFKGNDNFINVVNHFGFS